MSARLEQTLSQQYGLRVENITPGPHGFVAETFIIDTHRGRYFAKLVRISRYAENIRASLPLLLELRALGVDQINYPIPTIERQLSVIFDGYLLVLFNYIDGAWTFDYDFEQYVDLLARIHLLTEKVQTRVTLERFDLGFMVDMRRHRRMLHNREFSNPYQQHIQAVTAQHRAEIDEASRALTQLARRLRRRKPTGWRLTHGDGPGNVLQDARGKIYLIDWDDLLLAPCERDTWFHLGGEEHGTTFLDLYRRRFPEYQVDRAVFAYYVYWRCCNDLEGWYDKILAPETSDDQRAELIRHFDKDFFGWLQPMIRDLNHAPGI